VAKVKQSLFFKIFASIMAIVILILVFQTSVVSIIYKIQAKQFKNEVFTSFKNKLEQSLELGNDIGTQWSLPSIGPALFMAADDRISAIIVRDLNDNIVLTFGRDKNNDSNNFTDDYITNLGLPFPMQIEPKESVAGTITLYNSINSENPFGYVDVLVYSPLDYRLTAMLLWRMTLAFGITIPIALLIALLGSHLVGRSVSLNAAKIVKSLNQVAQGDYKVEHNSSTMRELNQISQSVSQLAVQLESHEKVRQQWLQSIAHDLNTPVTALRLTVDGALDQVVPIDNESLLEMQEQLDELERRVESVLILSSLEQPDFKIQRQSIDALDLADEVINTSHLDHPVTLDIKVETLNGDRRLLLLAFRELLKNASKYSTDKNSIKWSIYQGEELGSTIVQITNSASLDKKNLERAFEPWFRADTSRSNSGSGMGLAIVKHIVEFHKGEIDLISENEKVTVKLTLREV
jgi:signal transduction histidine kinase